MELFESKITAMISLTLGSMIAGLIPALFSSHSRNNSPFILSALLCFGGGVLLSTSLVHMLPEVRESVPKYQEYVELMFCAGYFIVYIIDEIFHYIYGIVDEKSNQTKNTYASYRRHSLTDCQKRHYGSVEAIYPAQYPYNPNFFTYSEKTSFAKQPLTTKTSVHQIEPCESGIGSLGLLTALSVHAILEGLAVGLENSPPQVLLLLMAIASHKLVVGFCLGVEITSNPKNSACFHFIAIAIFSFGSVFGIGIGIFITTVPTEVFELLLPILQCLAGGTLLYVTLSEVLPRERARWTKHTTLKCAGMLQFVSVVVGFVTMTILTKYMEH